MGETEFDPNDPHPFASMGASVDGRDIANGGYDYLLNLTWFQSVIISEFWYPCI